MLFVGVVVLDLFFNDLEIYYELEVAMVEEINSMARNESWFLIDFTLSQKEFIIIRCTM